MTVTALPQFTEEMTEIFARGVKDVAESLRPAAGRIWPEDMAASVAEVAPALASLIRRQRRRLEEVLRAGVPAERAAAQGRVLAALEELIEEIAAANLAREGEWLPPSAQPFFRALDEMLPEAEEFRRLLAPLVAKAKAALPPIDPARLRAGREALGRGEFKRSDDADAMGRDLAGDA